MTQTSVGNRTAKQSGETGGHSRVALVIMSVVLTAGLLAYVSSVAAVRQSGPELVTIIRRTWLPIFLLTFPYLGARYVVWHELLAELRISVPWRESLGSFAAGEIGKYAPAGAYVQNYLLAGVYHVPEQDAVRSTLATIVPLALETILALPVVLTVGIPHNRWISWTLGGIVLAYALIVATIWLVTHNRSFHSSSKAPRWLTRVAQDAAEIVAAIPDVISLRTVRLLVPTAVYMLTRVTDLYLIVRALGVQSLSFLDIMSVYGVMVIVNVVIPGKSEVGVLEATGMGSLRAYGMRASEAALAMLAWRLLASGLSILVSGVILLALWVEAQVRPGPTTRGRTPAGSTHG